MSWQEDVIKLLTKNKSAYTKEEVQLLILKDAVSEFVNKHFTGRSKAGREDYDQMVSAADVYKLKLALDKVK